MIQIQQSQCAVILMLNIVRYGTKELIPRKVEHVRILQLHPLVDGTREFIVVHAEKSPIVGSVRAEVRW